MKPSLTFEDLFHDPTYLAFKNHLYNYQLRIRAIRANVDVTRGLILEVGSGVSPILPPLPGIVHTDISAEAVRVNTANRSIRTGFAVDAAFIPLASASVETLVCSEVLEHIPDDTAALQEFARVIRPGGRMVITVPVHQYFFSADDRAVGHHRRYEVKELLPRLKTLGFGDFHTEIVTGLADKAGMLAATTMFGGGRGSHSPNDSRSGARLAWLLPLYKTMNTIYGGVAWLEARIIPEALATIVLIRAQRQSRNQH